MEPAIKGSVEYLTLLLDKAIEKNKEINSISKPNKKPVISEKYKRDRIDPYYWDLRLTELIKDEPLRMWCGCVVWWYIGHKYKNWEWFFNKYHKNYDTNNTMKLKQLRKALKRIGFNEKRRDMLSLRQEVEPPKFKRLNLEVGKF